METLGLIICIILGFLFYGIFRGLLEEDGTFATVVYTIYGIGMVLVKILILLGILFNKILINHGFGNIYLLIKILLWI